MNILVTGASAGLGLAFAQRAIAQGNTVWGVARRESGPVILQQQSSGRFTYLQCDVANPDDVNNAFLAMRQNGFLPDAIVLNAGIYPHDSDANFQFDVAQRVLSTNVNGALLFVGLFLPQFLERGSGQFVAVSSVLALRPDPLGASYAASKAALTMAFRSLALRYRKAGVEFKSVLFGPIATGDRKKPPLAFHLVTAHQAATAIERALSRRAVVQYYPWLLGLIFKTTAWFPDTVFNALTQPFRR